VRRAGGWLLALAMGCGEEAAPPDAGPEPAPPAALEAPSPPAPAATAAPWTAASIASLQPSPPTRLGRSTATLPPDPAWATTAARLGAVVDRYATDPANPWAIAHGMLARGPGLRLQNGQDAVDWLFAEYAEELPVGEARLVHFPPTRGAIRIEPHTDLVLKALTEAGVDPARVVQVQGRPHPVADLYRGSLLSTWLVPERNHSSFADPDDVPWALQALAAWSPPPLRWTARDGTPGDLDKLTLFGVAVLVKETRFLAEAKAAGADFQRQGQGLFTYTCGGAHLLQGVSYAVARGYGGERAPAAVEEQIALAFYRFPRELAIYDDAMKRMPEHELRLLVQRLKFVGHFLETSHRWVATGQLQPTPAQKADMDGAARQLALVVEALDQQGVLRGLDALRQRDEQLYLDVVGDSSHALRGLELALGTGSIAW
jgi:hypothetical protein